MRASPEAVWFEHRFRVPLTGREPQMVRLRAWLGGARTAGAWLLLHGPRGSGRTRLLDEAALVVGAEGAPTPLRVRPAPDGAGPFEPLRRALLERVQTDGTRGLARVLAELVPPEDPQVGALAAWLAGRDEAPEPAAILVLLSALSGQTPILVDDLDALDPAVLQVLRVAPAVIAAAEAGVGWLVPAAQVELEPLGEAQAELLLRRWLKHPATARRLAQELLPATAGCPGRLVHAVRALGRAGVLVRGGRGVVIATGCEAACPAGLDRRDPDAELRAVALLKGAPYERVLDAASVAAGSDAEDLLAQAARVKRGVVRALIEEAEAGRGGTQPGRVFSSEAARSAHAARLSPEARAALCGARVSAARRRASGGADAAAALDLAAALLAAGRPGEALGALGAGPDPIARALVVEPWMRRTLAQVALAQPAPLMGAPLVACARLARSLNALGAREEAARVRAFLGTPIPLPLTAALAHAESETGPGAPAALERLAAALEQGAHLATPDEVAEARLCAARGAFLRGRAVEARRHLSALPTLLRDAAQGLPGLSVRRRWHELCAFLARDARRPRAVAAHAERAASLATLEGRVDATAASLGCAGQAHATLGRPNRALAALTRAATLHALVRDAEQEIVARVAVGEIQADLAAYDEAAHTLEQAQAVARRAGLGGLSGRIHLLLAGVHHERGDLAAERQHAAKAVECATSAAELARATARLADADLRAGFLGAEGLLERAERDLRSLGLDRDALAARAALFDSRLCSRDLARARAALLGTGAHAPLRLRAARLALCEGRAKSAVPELRRLAEDPDLDPSLRAEAWLQFAVACERLDRLPEARAAAIAASGLLEIRRRSHANDARLHARLARLFRRCGEGGRAAGHRSAARRCLRLLAGAGQSSPERRRIARRELSADPRAAAPAVAV